MFFYLPNTPILDLLRLKTNQDSFCEADNFFVVWNGHDRILVQQKAAYMLKKKGFTQCETEKLDDTEETNSVEF